MNTHRQDPQCEFVTFETIQTYKGHKPDRTVVFTEKHDLAESEVQKSPSAQRFMRGTSMPPSGAQTTLSLSTTDLHRSTASSSSHQPPKPANGGSPLRQPNGHAAAGALPRPASSAAKLQHVQSQPHLNGTGACAAAGSSRSGTPQLSTLLRRNKSQSPVLRKTAPAGSSDFERDCLRAHNEFRARHAVQPLRLNRKLCRFAEEWAKVIAARGTPAHRNNSPYGENIFCSWSSASAVHVEGGEPAEHWYGEGVQHVFGREPTTLKTGHFTQVVWRDSRELGVGIARNR